MNTNSIKNMVCLSEGQNFVGKQGEELESELSLEARPGVQIPSLRLAKWMLCDSEQVTSPL